MQLMGIRIGEPQMANQSGAGLREARNINQSLCALSTVMKALRANATDAKHIPYRDSKLTYMLKVIAGTATRSHCEK